MTFVFYDYPGLEYGLPKFHDFPGPVVTLTTTECYHSNEPVLTLTGTTWSHLLLSAIIPAS